MAMPSGRYESRPFSPDRACIKALKAQGLGATEIADQVGSNDGQFTRFLGGGLGSNRAFLRSLRSFCLSRFDYLSFRTNI
jgi:hypothetical protein